MDRLDEMFRMQAELQRRINGYDITEQSNDTRVENITLNVLAAKMELAELLNEIGWKPWARSKHINRAAAQNELVDVWHFLMNLMLHLGMTPRDLYEGYLEKNAKNFQRQDDGYDGVKGKCPACKRDLGDIEIKEIRTESIPGFPRVDLHCVCGTYLGSRAV